MSKSINAYGLYRLKIEIKNLLKQFLRIQSKPKRDKLLINEIYENIRQKKFENLDRFSTPEDYLFDNTYIYPNGKIRYSLLFNRIVYGKSNHIAMLVLEIIEGVMISTTCKYVIELGSGGGKNLIWFASKYKNIKFIGLELNKTSVELANAAAKKFNITNIEFRVCDLTNPKEYSELLTKQTFVYSHHTLEEMPGIYQIPLNEIKNSNVETVALLEPIYFFSFSRFFLDISKRIRILNKDRLIGLKNFANRQLKKKFHIELIDLGIGVKPENPTSLLVLKRKK